MVAIGGKDRAPATGRMKQQAKAEKKQIPTQAKHQCSASHKTSRNYDCSSLRLPDQIRAAHPKGIAIQPIFCNQAA